MNWKWICFEFWAYMAHPTLKSRLDSLLLARYVKAQICAPLMKARHTPMNFDTAITSNCPLIFKLPLKVHICPVIYNSAQYISIDFLNIDMTEPLFIVWFDEVFFSMGCKSREWTKLILSTVPYCAKWLSMTAYCSKWLLTPILKKCHTEQLSNVYRANMFAFDSKGRERAHIRPHRWQH